MVSSESGMTVVKLPLTDGSRGVVEMCAGEQEGGVVGNDRSILQFKMLK